MADLQVVLPSLHRINTNTYPADVAAQVGVFDTAFHQTMPPHAFMYGIPYEYYSKYKVGHHMIRSAGRRKYMAQCHRCLPASCIWSSLPTATCC